MKQYRVIALSVGGRGNRIFESGDTVTENNFTEGRAAELENQGFLKEIGETAEEAAPPAAEEAEVTEPNLAPPATEETVEVKDAVEETDEYKAITRNELMEQLTNADVEFSKNASKAELFALWKTEKAKE